ncbi:MULTISPECIES: FUSC family protein [Streptomycetaceae]|uniref:Integral membrane protein n=1 Tax=Streptantibioticus cattleyicolor (strain ATCC 35852 / DSM 46488 / JCM 4925 / NBRC 14057 / NRRL 8057) TaxID=1003195 RepID=F8JST0_STREN|nr:MULTISPECIES: FUSC family protein [Streptomycetaceae]AEW97986.1 integral membrane protein [Streptantibioticus cattleyicolor NRRL 8057 = DSM 46488]MYS62386.1 FUSC family protein [Streptomyces sp. SID5468]CCB78304.1 putative integral membrane protein [Streptantibioticus cattleyicolor NRRL 8057 = DSM 46488]
MVKQSPAPTTPRGPLVRALPLRSTVRLGRALDIWHKPASSALVAAAAPELILLAVGRLDLALYASAGALAALYGHGLPYAARARALAWVVLGMVASVGLALTAASLTRSAPVLVVAASLLAAVHKMVCDATRIGPPGNIIVTFVAATSFFVPQRLADVPGHLAITLACGALAWAVCMAPALVRPDGPQRVTTARALEAAARLLTAGPEETTRARHATAAAVNAAWHTLFLVPARAHAAGRSRVPFERLLARAETALTVAPVADAERFTRWARDLRKGRALPDVAPGRGGEGELAGIAVERALHHPAPGPRGVRAALARLRPGSPLLPIGARVAVGCTAAGWLSMVLGVGHPYWAVVTAAAIHQANITLSWQRAVQRTLGNFLGLLLFTALLPLSRTGHLAMVLLALAFQFGAEALISRNYWLGSVCVTPMALLLSQFGNASVGAGTLVRDRWTDTVVGAVVGVLAAVLVTNRRAADRLHGALERVARAQDAGLELEARCAALRLRSAGAALRAAHDEAGLARDRLMTALIELREAMDVAAGEWWQRALPEERVALAERDGHQVLGRLVELATAPPLAA